MNELGEEQKRKSIDWVRGEADGEEQ